jgi:hypothetical protein
MQWCHAPCPWMPASPLPSCFGGLLFPLPPNPPYVEDPNGYVVGVIDTRLPPLLTNPVPVNDVNWPAEMFKNMGGLPQHQWTAANLGQVFGLTLDSAPAPNIYVAATTLYGNFTVGPGGPGAVYRLDGVTGDICLVLQLPNGGPALGQLTHDPVSNHLFISNFEDGLIYSVSLTPVNGSACSLGNWTTYDHGVQGRPDEGLAPIPDAGSLNTFTDLGRRVWGVCVYQNRLYYSVWWEDFGRPNTVDQNEIWSVQIDSSGNMLAGTAVREAIIPDYPFNTWACPVSDIEFTEGGGMLIAERTIGGDKGQARSRPARFTQFAYPEVRGRVGQLHHAAAGHLPNGQVQHRHQQRWWRHV